MEIEVNQMSNREKEQKYIRHSIMQELANEKAAEGNPSPWNFSLEEMKKINSEARRRQGAALRDGKCRPVSFSLNPYAHHDTSEKFRVNDADIHSTEQLSNFDEDDYALCARKASSTDPISAGFKQIVMKQDFKASPDGLNVRLFKTGFFYIVRDSLAGSLVDDLKVAEYVEN